MKKRLSLGLLGVVVAAFLALASLRHDTPKGQPALTNLTQDNLKSFESDFDNSSDAIRVLVLLSPT